MSACTEWSHTAEGSALQLGLDTIVHVSAQEPMYKQTCRRVIFAAYLVVSQFEIPRYQDF